MGTGPRSGRLRATPWAGVAGAACLLLASLVACAGDAPATARFYDVHGAKLYVERFGHGTPIVFLHGGMTFFGNTFEKQRDAFSRDHTVIGIDQRGHGHSPDGPWQLSYQLMADDTAAVITALGLGPADVVGLSDGANIALLLARDHPELVRRVVASGANLRSGVPADEQERRSHWTDEQWATKVAKAADGLPPWIRADYGRVSPDGADHYLAILGKCYRMWSQGEVIAPLDLKRIEAPVLVMAGDHDFASIEENAEIYRGLAHAALLILPATHHGTFGERPELVNLAVREFLEAPVPTATAR